MGSEKYQNFDKFTFNDVPSECHKTHGYKAK